jgi:hypothetical protein
VGHIAFAMAVVVAMIGGFGLRTRGLARSDRPLERSPQISRIPGAEFDGG